LQTLAVVAAISIPTLLWSMHSSPQWMAELHANMAAHYGRGAVDDPGPTTVLNRGTFVLTNLQAVFSFIADRPAFYNSITYLICILLLMALLGPTIKRRVTKEAMLLGVASMAALSLLPLYHRQYDAKILILTVPACALMWSKGGWIARATLCVEFAGLALTGDLPWAFLRPVVSSLQTSDGQSSILVKLALAFPVPIALLAMTFFFIWIYLKRLNKDETKESF
jgi:hypothetical protein